MPSPSQQFSTRATLPYDKSPLPRPASWRTPSPARGGGGGRRSRRNSSHGRASSPNQTSTGETADNGGGESDVANEKPNPNSKSPASEPGEIVAPLPDEAPPSESAAGEDDGWMAKQWEDPTTGYTHWYFENRFTGVSQWENPRASSTAGTSAPVSASYSATATAGASSGYNGYATSGNAFDYGNGYGTGYHNHGDGYGNGSSAASSAYVPNSTTGAPGTNSSSAPGVAPGTSSSPTLLGGYNPSVHGDWDWNADYARKYRTDIDEPEEGAPTDGAGETTDYSVSANFNSRTGNYQHDSLNPERFSAENRARRQQSAYYSIDDAANDHGGISLKAERRKQKHSKKQVAEWNRKKKEKKWAKTFAYYTQDK